MIMANKLNVHYTEVYMTTVELETFKDIVEFGNWVGNIIEAKQDDIHSDMKELCLQIALLHGLPEVKGCYGLTLAGEFVYRLCDENTCGKEGD